MSNSYYIPTVYETTERGTRASDIFSKLLDDRIVFLNGGVDEVSSNLIISQLLYLESVDNEAPIYLYINSPGGSVYAGLQIIDTMNFINAPVYTVCTGIAMSMGFAILTSGEKGYRYALKNATLMCHRVSSGSRGNIQEMEIDMEETKRLDNLLTDMIAKNIGMTTKKYLKYVIQDHFLTSYEGLKFGSEGVIDKVITNKKEL